MSIIKEGDSTFIYEISIAFSFSLVFWIDASWIGTITWELKSICNMPAAQLSKLDGSPESALQWIGLLKDSSTLVFDNADVLTPAELEAYLPPGRGENILITSCNLTMRSLDSPVNSLEVTEMEKNGGIELLLKASFLNPPSMRFQTKASKIVKELCCLPHANDQAGAYIASGATSIGDYLEKYFEHTKTLLLHLNLLELQSITEQSMKLGSYHTRKFNKELDLMFLIKSMQPIVQCSFWISFHSSIMRQWLKKYFLMLLKKWPMLNTVLYCTRDC